MRFLVTVLVCIFLVSCNSRDTSSGVASSGVGVAGGAPARSSGVILGAVIDEQDRKVVEQSSPRTIDRMDRGEPLTVNDIVKLHESGIGDDVIIGYIHDTRTSYNLSQAQIRKLQDAGVSQRTINYMIDTGR